jgi:hypothetical protein
MEKVKEKWSSETISKNGARPAKPTSREKF